MGVNALQEMGLPTSFFMYAPVGVPMLILGIIYFVCLGYRFLPNKTEAVGTVQAQKDFSNVPKWKQTVSLAVLIAVILAMIFEDEISVSIQISSCIGAAILVVTKVIDEKAALKSIDLEVVLLFGGSLALAKALDVTGAGNLIADKIVGFLGTSPDPMVLLLVIFIVTCTMTNFMSNTATTALMVPIAVSLANNVGADARRCHRHCYRRLLCLRNTDWYASKHHGCRTWRLSLQGLCKIRSSADWIFICGLHGFAANPVSILPVIIYLNRYNTHKIYKFVL